MTSFSTLESSVQDSEPIEVYVFTIGTVTYRYTSSGSSVTVGGNTYPAEPIERNNLVQGPDSRSHTMEIRVPSTNSFASLYLTTVPGEKATLTIIRLQRNESPTFNTQVVVFKGFVASVNFSDQNRLAVIGAKSLESAGSRSIPTYTYQGQCNHQLYGPGCGVDPAPYRHSGIVTAVSGNTITVSGLNASGLDFKGGWVRPATVNDPRLILSQSGDVLTLLLPFAASALNQTVDAFAGCDHNLTGDCSNTFDNAINFGGFAFVPNKNIFTTGMD